MQMLGPVARLVAGLALAGALLQADPCGALAAAPVRADPEGSGLPRLPAPLGLSFGMRPDEVPLPVVESRRPRRVWWRRCGRPLMGVKTKRR